MVSLGLNLLEPALSRIIEFVSLDGQPIGWVPNKRCSWPGMSSFFLIVLEMSNSNKEIRLAKEDILI